MRALEIINRIPTPTGTILVVNGEHGKLECLSLGDYGKEVNLKADYMGLTREPERVRHTDLLPLTDKWVVTISTQYGCSMNCRFCDVPNVGTGVNATANDLVGQVYAAMSLHPEIRHSERLNIHYARMGEPTFNPNVIPSTRVLTHTLRNFRLHPVVSTMMPKRNSKLTQFLDEWLRFKNDNNGEAGLQLSINSTNENERAQMFSGNALPLEAIADMFNHLPRPQGRKITLNFAVADWKIDAPKMVDMFSPEWFIVKLTPMHKTSSALDNNIRTKGDCTTYYPYRIHEANLKAAGFDVLVFIASKEEDESRVTCGNAILSNANREGSMNINDALKRCLGCPYQRKEQCQQYRSSYVNGQEVAYCEAYIMFDSRVPPRCWTPKGSVECEVRR